MVQNSMGHRYFKNAILDRCSTVVLKVERIRSQEVYICRLTKSIFTGWQKSYFEADKNNVLMFTKSILTGSKNHIHGFENNIFGGSEKLYLQVHKKYIFRFTPQMEIVYQSVASFFVQTLIEGYNGDVT